MCHVARIYKTSNVAQGQDLAMDYTIVLFHCSILGLFYLILLIPLAVPPTPTNFSSFPATGGSPKHFQNRNVSSAPAETTDRPSGLVAI